MAGPFSLGRALRSSVQSIVALLSSYQALHPQAYSKGCTNGVGMMHCRLIDATCSSCGVRSCTHHRHLPGIRPPGHIRQRRLVHWASIPALTVHHLTSQCSKQRRQSRSHHRAGETRGRSCSVLIRRGLTEQTTCSHRRQHCCRRTCCRRGSKVLLRCQACGTARRCADVFVWSKTSNGTQCGQKVLVRRGPMRGLVNLCVLTLVSNRTTCLGHAVCSWPLRQPGLGNGYKGDSLQTQSSTQGCRPGWSPVETGASAQISVMSISV